MKCLKYHALGNDYIVLSPESFPSEMTPDIVSLKSVRGRNDE